MVDGLERPCLECKHHRSVPEAIGYTMIHSDKCARNCGTKNDYVTGLVLEKKQKYVSCYRERKNESFMDVVLNKERCGEEGKFFQER